MKKTYEKPAIIFEDFSLSTSIAAGCELVTPLPTSDDGCGYPTRGGIIFIEGTQCTTYPQDGSYNGFCYHVPAETSNLFNS
ncbi:MAG: hypothetical protein IJ357_06505 [Oscillospiraceae bacterium]|nr:hypothetical protein [Oscillospiraceae bacterium]